MFSNFLKTYSDNIFFLENNDFIRFINFAAVVDMFTIGELLKELDSKEARGLGRFSIYTLIRHLFEYDEAK